MYRAILAQGPLLAQGFGLEGSRGFCAARLP